MYDNSINIKMNNSTIEKAMILFKNLGTDIDSAINLFINKSLKIGGFPFEIDEPNEVTLKAFEEGEKMLADPNAKRYKSSEELFAELDQE